MLLVNRSYKHFFNFLLNAQNNFSLSTVTMVTDTLIVSFSITQPLWDYKHGRLPLKTRCFYKVQQLKASSGYKDFLKPTGERGWVSTGKNGRNIPGHWFTTPRHLHSAALAPLRRDHQHVFFKNKACFFVLRKQRGGKGQRETQNVNGMLL